MWIVQQNRDGEQNLYKQFGLFSIGLIITSSLLGAQSFADFKNAQTKSFNQYKDERDAAFSNYLKKQWKEYNAQMSKPLYEKPKPKIIEEAKVSKIKPVGPKIHIFVKPPKKVQKAKPVVKTPVVKKEPIVKKTPTAPKNEKLPDIKIVKIKIKNIKNKEQ